MHESAKEHAFSKDPQMAHSPLLPMTIKKQPATPIILSTTPLKQAEQTSLPLQTQTSEQSMEQHQHHSLIQNSIPSINGTHQQNAALLVLIKPVQSLLI